MTDVVVIIFIVLPLLFILLGIGYLINGGLFEAIMMFALSASILYFDIKSLILWIRNR